MTGKNRGDGLWGNHENHFDSRLRVDVHGRDQ